MRSEYKEFISSKIKFRSFTGMTVKPDDVHPKLFAFQRDVVVWACKKGRSAIFLDTGLGKTFVQLEWARLIEKKTLIIAPLSVARQTVREAKKIGIDLKYVRHQSECDDEHTIFITNYEMIDWFDPSLWGGVVLDESSILKSLDGKTRRKLIDMFRDTPFRLCCTATPAPNDQTEIGNHSEFLGVASMAEMLSMFFVNANKVSEIDLGDGRVVKSKQAGKNGQEYRLRNHAIDHFYKWMSSWSIALRKPSDLGYDDNGYILPEMTIKPLFIEVDYHPTDQLFFTKLAGIKDRHSVRKATLEDRVRVAADLVNKSDEQWIVWCELNEEGDALESAIPDAIQVQGSDSQDDKVSRIESFQDGNARVLISKPKIAGFGMNFQNAHNMVFVGLSDSWEAYYQCIRRQWRFGQQHPVNVYIVLSEAEREIYQNVMQKEKVAARMSDELIKHVRDYEKVELHSENAGAGEVRKMKTMTVPAWVLINAKLSHNQERN